MLKSKENRVFLPLNLSLENANAARIEVIVVTPTLVIMTITELIKYLKKGAF
jgi:hypothetical protein